MLTQTIFVVLPKDVETTRISRGHLEAIVPRSETVAEITGFVLKTVHAKSASAAAVMSARYCMIFALSIL